MSARPSPIPCEWNGESFSLLPRFAKQADAQYVIGQTYRMCEHEDRSRATHNHFFSCVHEYWLQLPEGLAARFATADHLRRFALIRTGFPRSSPAGRYVT